MTYYGSKHTVLLAKLLILSTFLPKLIFTIPQINTGMFQQKAAEVSKNSTFWMSRNSEELRKMQNLQSIKNVLARNQKHVGSQDNDTSVSLRNKTDLEIMLDNILNKKGQPWSSYPKERESGLVWTKNFKPSVSLIEQIMLDQLKFEDFEKTVDYLIKSPLINTKIVRTAAKQAMLLRNDTTPFVPTGLDIHPEKFINIKEDDGEPNNKPNISDYVIIYDEDSPDTKINGATIKDILITFYKNVEDYLYINKSTNAVEKDKNPNGAKFRDILMKFYTNEEDYLPINKSTIETNKIDAETNKKTKGSDYMSTDDEELPVDGKPNRKYKESAHMLTDGEELPGCIIDGFLIKEGDEATRNPNKPCEACWCVKIISTSHPVEIQYGLQCSMVDCPILQQGYCKKEGDCCYTPCSKVSVPQVTYFLPSTISKPLELPITPPDIEMTIPDNSNEPSTPTKPQTYIEPSTSTKLSTYTEPSTITIASAHTKPSTYTEALTPTKPSTYSEPSTSTESPTYTEPPTSTKPPTYVEPPTPTKPSTYSELSTPTKPSTYIEHSAPTKPSTYIELSTPTKPSTYTETTTSTKPSIYTEPSTPTKPSTYTEPSTPTKSSTNNEPSTPTVPLAPTEPPTSIVPSSPSEPSTPGRSKMLSEPSMPNEPSTTHEPLTPTVPSAPTESSTSIVPSTPSDLLTPGRSQMLSEPSMPNEPSTTHEPSTPTVPSAPTEPSTSIVLSRPSDLLTPGRSQMLSEPSMPNELSTTHEPSTPTVQSAPTEPSTSIVPSTPSEPSTPGRSQTLSEPSMHNEPSTTHELSTPTEPSIPSELITSSELSTPYKPSTQRIFIHYPFDYTVTFAPRKNSPLPADLKKNMEHILDILSNNNTLSIPPVKWEKILKTIGKRMGYYMKFK